MAELTFSIPWRRDLPKKLATVLFGFGAGLLVCELGVRLFWSMPLLDRFELKGPDRGVTADCYPRAPDASFPIDLATPEGREGFLRAFPKGVRALSRSDFEESSPLLALRAETPTPEAMELLRAVMPLCVVYDHREESPRHEVTPARYGETIALLGDSFVFGQGIAETDTFTARLSKLLDARVRSYAFMGADLPEVESQFRRAMNDLERYRFKKIVYVYVLNDPLRKEGMNRRLHLLNDLMNVRFSAVLTERKTPFDAWIARAARHSMLVRALVYRFSRRSAGERTLEWYRDLHDPAVNPGIEATFHDLVEMRKAAASRGVDFIILVYPLMLDMAHYPLPGVHQALRDFARENRLELHDMLPAFQKSAGDQVLTVHPIDYHPNARAQAIAAEDAAEYLKTRSRK